MPISRITFSSSMLLVRNNLAKVQQQYEEASVPATTGRKINNLSDDSTVLSRLFSLRSETILNEQYQKNILDIRQKLNITDSQLATASDILEQVRETALQANDPTIDQSLRDQLSNQISLYKEQLLGVANFKSEGKYMFAGSAIYTEPFQDSGGGVITFNGNSNSLSTQINDAVSVVANFDGDKLFTGNIDTAVGTSLATSLKDSNSHSLGLVVGDVITINGSVGVNPLNSTLTITSTTSLSDIASFMQTAIRAQGNNTEVVAVRPDGSLRVTSGAAAIANLTLTVPSNTTFNGAFLYSTPIAGGGATANSDTLQTGTGEDIFDVFDDLAQAIEDADQTELSTALDRLDTSLQQILEGRATVGIRTRQVQSIETEISEATLHTLESLSDVEDADLDVVLSDLVLRETALRTVFASSTKILNVTSSLAQYLQ